MILEGATRGDGSKRNQWASLSFACSSVVTASNIIHVNSGKYIENRQCALAVGVNIEGEEVKSLIISHYLSKDEVNALILLKSSPMAV